MRAAREVDLPVTDGRPGRGLLVLPTGDGPHPAVLVLHEIVGLNDDMERIAYRFAEAGYVALAPDYFGPGQRIRCVLRAVRSVKTGRGPTFERLDGALGWLRSRDDVDADRVAVAGFCMGGGFAVLQAARSDVRAVATFYGDVPRDRSALDGIPPCMGGYGDRDRIFGPLADRLRLHLDGLEVEHDVVSYPDVGHSFCNQTDGLLVRLGSGWPMRVGHNSAAADDAWRRMMEWFSRYV